MLPLILLALPVAEITGFILVGGAIGLLPTLGLIDSSRPCLDSASVAAKRGRGNRP